MGKRALKPVEDIKSSIASRQASVLERRIQKLRAKEASHVARVVAMTKEKYAGKISVLEKMLEAIR